MTVTNAETPGARSGPRTPFRPKATPHPGTWIGAAIVLVVAALIAYVLATSPNIDWSIIGQYQFKKQILEGLAVTVELTVICQALGIVLGILVALMRMSQNRIISTAAWCYVFFFRGTPVLVQLVFWYNISAILPHINAHLPFSDLIVVVNVNALISGFTAAVLGLSLHEAALMSEVFRGGIGGIDAGQTEAAVALGMRRRQAFFRIVLPQVVRLILPVTANQLVTLLKTTAMVAFIAGGDLLTAVTDAYSHNFHVIELLIVASIWYLICVALASALQHALERRFGRGVPGRTVQAVE